MDGFTREEARAFYDVAIDEVAAGKRLLVAAFLDGKLVGSVQMAHAWAPNQPHRGDIAKLLVHRSARRRGIAQRLMDHVEAESRAHGKTLLVLDAVTDGPAARLYAARGWTTVGVVPDFALYPDGRFCDTTYFFKKL